MLNKRPAGADAAHESGQRRSMTVVSRVLLGTASGFAMVVAAHAAGLEDKAEPVQFVKICNRDGHSYYYVPGNDACTKNGLSLTIGTDERRSNSLMNLSAGDAPGLGGQPSDRQGDVWRDPFISLRTDQAWGYGALVGGARNAHAAYSGDNSALSNSAVSELGACLQAGTIDCGRGNDKAGFFFALGGELKVPIFGAGDRIGAGVRFGQGGSSGFGSGGLNLSTPELAAAGNNLAAGWLPDGGSGIDLTTAWSVQAGYDHQWSPSLNTSLFAGYANVTVDTDTAGFTGATCGSPGSGAAAQAGINCKSNWGNMGAGLRTSWAPATGLTLSVQTMYNYVWSGFTGTGNVFGGAPAPRPADSYNFANQGIWSSYLRINRTFNTGD